MSDKKECCCEEDVKNKECSCEEEVNNKGCCCSEEKEVKTVKPSKKDKVSKLEEEVKTLTDKLLRNSAELENFKKRTQEERIRERKYSSMYLVGELVNSVDNFSKACNMKTDDEKLKNFLIGFNMISKQIMETLKNEGLEEIKDVKMFDPNIHHAVSSEECLDKENGCILEVLNTGYKYKDRVLRPTMVKVNKKENDENE